MRIRAQSLTFNTTDMSQATCTSSWVEIQAAELVAIQVAYTGSPVGSLVLQGSNDQSVVTSLVDTTYDSTIAVAAAGNSLWNLGNVGFPYIRVLYTKTSGTGTISGTINGKGSPGGS
jgi:hypothetical protein